MNCRYNQSPHLPSSYFIIYNQIWQAPPDSWLNHVSTSCFLGSKGNKLKWNHNFDCSYEWCYFSQLPLTTLTVKIYANYLHMNSLSELTEYSQGEKELDLQIMFEFLWHLGLNSYSTFVVCVWKTILLL